MKGEPWQWIDGTYLRLGPRALKAFSPGILSGLGVFETLRVDKGKMFAFDSHWQRMRRGLGRLGITPPRNKKKFQRTIEELLTLNDQPNARIRIMVWNDREGQHQAIFSLNLPFQNDYLSRGWKACVSSVILRPSADTGIKSLKYQAHLRAYEEARARGYDEALMLNARHELVEGSRCNVFFLREKVLFTPSLSCGCLPGIIRSQVIKLAGEMDILCRQRRLDLADLRRADEAFLTNAVVRIVPLIRVDAFPIGDGRVGLTTHRMQGALAKIINNPH